MSWTPHLRYSPANGIVINWGLGSEPFSLACLPKPNCEGPTPVPTPQDCGCGEQPIVQAVDTYDWYRWVPEIVAGFEDVSEDMAAAYARRAAREFAQKGWVLQRQIAMCLQPDVLRYPLEAFSDEVVEGVLRIDSASGGCACESTGGLNIGSVKIDQAKQEVVFTPTRGCCGAHVRTAHGPRHLLLTVWAAPTEDSCKHDVFLYEKYRREITLGARAALIDEVVAHGSYKTSRGYANHRGDAMMYSRGDRLRSDFERAMRKARVEATTQHEFDLGSPAAAFAIAGCCR